MDNKIGILLIQTSTNNVFYNVISENNFGILIFFATGFTISYNDITVNSIYGLCAILGIGTATWNYWGSIWGPYLGGVMRIIPPLPIVFPYSAVPNIPTNLKEADL